MEDQTRLYTPGSILVNENWVQPNSYVVIMVIRRKVHVNEGGNSSRGSGNQAQ